ncbi:hypothetical protein LOTGIDRAFT_163640 [Lottia gigantea]|uniref:Uncharacterized protein n=1 Tax=Lottia gigantea TaxID=225164 RepID=V3ZHL4_LOTGI|nr:hypothetical protein LOTGIDRAFT_163640 [Lottia gigantea]ESO90758.1 hypothetical protein LOTGIDRAFT_163640 [Lottia gigantea]
MAKATCSQKVKSSRECKRFALDDILTLLDDNDSDLELSDDNDPDYLEDPVDTIDNQSEDEDSGINNSDDDEEQLLAASREDSVILDAQAKLVFGVLGVTFFSVSKAIAIAFECFIHDSIPQVLTSFKTKPRITCYLSAKVVACFFIIR